MLFIDEQVIKEFVRLIIKIKIIHYFIYNSYASKQNSTIRRKNISEKPTYQLLLTFLKLGLEYIEFSPGR